MSPRAVCAVTCATVLATACGASRKVPFEYPSNVPAAGTRAFDVALLQATGAEFEGGHQIRLVQNGEVFDAIVGLIGEARESVNIVVYIWRKSAPSDRVLEALAQRRPGVSCRVLVDPVGSVDFGEAVQPELERMGCEVLIFRPLLDTPADELTLRNHRKLVIVDGRMGLTGGFGIWTSWLGDGVSSEEQWRDANIVVAGPAVRHMQVAFARNWQEAGGQLLPPEDFPPLRPDEDGARAAFVASAAEPGRTDADRMTQLLFGSAKERLWVSNAYFVPNEAILEVLERQARSGVDVRLLVSGPVHDWKSVLAAQRDTYPRMLAAGVRIFEYQPSMMHAKTALVDDRLSLVGSTNLDPLSLNRLEEGSVLVDDPKLAAQMEAQFLRDVVHAREITAGEIPGNGLWHDLARDLFGILD